MFSPNAWLPRSNFCFRQLIGQFRKRRKDLFECFLGLQKAHDCIPRSKLLSVFAEYEINGTMIYRAYSDRLLRMKARTALVRIQT